MLKLISFLFFIFQSIAFANGISMDNLPIGENRIHFEDKEIQISIEQLDNVKVQAIISKNSLQWVRDNEILLIPRIRLKIKAHSSDANLFINYKDKLVHFQKSAKNSYTELYYSLFERQDISVFYGNKKIAIIKVRLINHKKKKLIVDYTCSRNSIKVHGIDDEHFSLGCKTRSIGKYGNAKAMLEVQWISPELKIIGSDFAPTDAAFLNQRPVKFQVENIYTKEQKTITIFAKIPKRLHRIFTAYGFGPYALNTELIDKDTLQVETKKANMAPALFFYLNYKLGDGISLRGFDAAIFQESVFNNAGLYLGSDFGFSLDNKLYFTTLLGMQYLFFKYDESHDVVSEPIFPQGLEFMYRHAFDIPNYIISGGIFLSTERDIDYENVWIRWGKNYFWELNLIAWGKGEFKARTWGVSVGIPFKGFF